MAEAARHQSYDNLLKRFLENQPAAIIPLLFPELASEVVEELNTEVLIPPRRADRVYKSRAEENEEEMLILHVEFESSANGKMDKRLLIYHVLLLEKYELPIISIIVYPFEVSMVTSPLKEARRNEEILSFKYQTLPLWKEDARTYVEGHAVPLYGLLPTMDGISGDLLLQAIEEMVQYYGTSNELLRDELLCFRVLLARAKRLPEAELLRVERRVRMFDPLLEEDPWVQEKLAERELRGKAEGVFEGKLEEARDTLVKFVQRRFPSLAELARTRAMQIDQLEDIHALNEQLWFAADEYAARALLEESTTS